MNPLVFATATDTAALIRQGQASAREVLELYLRQIDAYNASINALITIDREAALSRARQADEALARGEVWGPLHGVPVTLKDCHSTDGMRTTSGFPPLAEYVPGEDGTVAARLRGAGAIIIGKTNLAPLTFGLQTDNPLFGRTNNPWNPDMTAGGSSGGACAALAAGLTALDVGSDRSGSNRIPAHMCGVFGIKPTFGRIPFTGHIPDLPGTPRFDRWLSVIGPLARSVEDLHLAFRLLVGTDGRDAEVSPVPTSEAQVPSIKGLRLAWASALPGGHVASSIRGAIERLAGQLEGEGAHVEERLPAISFDDFASVWEQLSGVGLGLWLQIMGPLGFPAPPDVAASPTLLDMMLILQKRDGFIEGVEKFFAEWDALVLPVTMTTAFPHCEPGTPLLVDGLMVEYDELDHHCRLFSFTGHPAVVVPIAQDEAGLPIGVQMVGRRWDDDRLLAIAQRVSEVVGPFRRPPLAETSV